MKLISTVLFLLLFILGFGQPDPTKVDGLKLKLAEASNDSIKIRTMVELSYHLSYKDITQAKGYSDAALEIANKNNWPWAKSLSYSSIGNLFDLAGDYANALESSNKRLQVELLGSDSLKIAIGYLNVGNSYIELAKFEEAYYYTKKSLDISQQIKDTLNIAIATHNMAKIYSKIGRFDLALSHFNLSGELSAIAHDLQGPAYNNHELGNSYILSGNYRKALEHLLIALNQSKKLGIMTLTPRIYKSIGEASLLLKDYSKSLAYYDTAINLFKQNKNLFGQSRASLGKSNVFKQQKKYKEANALALASLKTAQGLKAQILNLECYITLSQIAETNGDFKNAYAYNKKAELTRDSLTHFNVLSQVFESEFQMRSQRKDEEIASLTKLRQEYASDLKRQEFIRNIFAVVFALTAVLLYSVYRSGKRKASISEMQVKHQKEIEKRTQELEELNKVKDKFFSIISHDLRSPINSMSGLLDLMGRNEIKPEELPALTKELRAQFTHTKNLINNLLDWTLVQMNKVSIKKENIKLRSLIDENIKLLSSTTTKKSNFVNEIDESITAFGDQNMINLVFRNLILNGIKFTDSAGTITISAVQAGKEIRVSVADNGVGIAPEVQKLLFEKTTGYTTRGTANEKGTGLGLILAKEFIERNGGKNLARK